MIALLLIGAIAVTGGLFLTMSRAREKGYALVLWLPAVILCPGSVWYATLSTHGPWAGLVLLPLWIVGGLFFIVTLVLRPRGKGWNGRGAAAGFVVTAVLPLFYYWVRTETVTVVVVDVDGKPVADRLVEFQTSSWGRRSWDADGKTDQQGRVTQRVFRGDFWAARASTSDGTLCQVGLAMPNEAVDRQAQLVEVGWFWSNNRWTNWVSSGFKRLLRREDTNPLELRLRSADELISTWVIRQVREQITRAETEPSNSRFRLELQYAPEIYPVIPDLISLLKSGRLDRDSFSIVAERIAEALALADETVRKSGSTRSSPEDEVRLKCLRQWVGALDPAKDRDVAVGMIKAAVARQVTDLVEVLVPSWPEWGPVGLAPLNSLIGPQSGRTFEVMAGATPEVQDQFARQLIRMSLPSDQVAPYWQHPVRVVAVTAIICSQREIPADRMGELLKPLSRPGDRTWIQYEIEHALKQKSP